MRRVASLIGLACALAITATTAFASGLDGEWIGGFDNGRNWVFVRVWLSGEHTAPAGRIDLPQNGERRITLANVRLCGGAMRFEVPGTYGSLQFDGTLEGDRIRGTVRQGNSESRFELLRTRLVTADAFRPFAGTYELSPGVPLLVFMGPQGPAFVDHRDGRLGSLYPIDAATFVSGRTLLAGFPVEVSLRFERAAGAPAHAVVIERKGQRTVRAVRRAYYGDEPVTLSSGDASLAGTLLVPSGEGPFPAIVMIQGSGAAARETLMPVADAFARNGVAVLFHDKRGTGQSTGSWARATFEDLANDALAGVEYLKRRVDIDKRAIGLHGASLGGWVAPLAATRSSDVAFIIVEAAPTTTPAEHERLRVERQMLADGVAAALVARAVEFMDEKAKVARSGQGWDDLVRTMELGRRQGWLHYTNPPTSLESLQWNWTHIMSFDPVPVLERVRVPVLALFGERDTTVAPALNRARLEEALARGGNRDVTVRLLPGANHHFLAARTGGPTEVPMLAGFVAGYFATSDQWLNARRGASPVAPAVASRAGAASPGVADAGASLADLPIPFLLQ